MASRENQGLQIALMVFALLVVLFAITTYVYFKSYDDASKQVASLKSDNQNSQRLAQQTQEEMNTLKELMGFSADDNLATIQEGHKRDMEAYAAAYPEDEQKYRKLVENQASEIRAIGRRELESQQRERDLNQQYAALEAENSGRVQKYLEEMNTIKVDADGERDTFASDRAKITADAQKFADQLQTKQTEIQQLQVSTEETLKKRATEVADLRFQKQKIEKRLDQYESVSFEVADGKIIGVNQLTETVWIDLGRSDALAKQVTFSVYGVDENEMAQAKIKGTIEVMRIIDSHLAQARITSDEVSDPILPHDKIYSPVWERGRRESFALAGFIDIDGDEKSDRAKVRDLIELNGGVIDAEAHEDGSVTGQMTINTKFLVLGDPPRVSPRSDATADKIFAGYSDLQSQAENKGVTTINVKQFLDHMGWRPDDQTVMLRRGTGPAMGEAAGSTGATPSPFRPRRPKYIRY